RFGWFGGRLFRLLLGLSWLLGGLLLGLWLLGLLLFGLCFFRFGLFRLRFFSFRLFRLGFGFGSQAGGEVPDPSFAVFASGHQRFAVGIECDAEDLIGVSFERRQQGAVCHIEHTDLLVGTCSGEL